MRERRDAESALDMDLDSIIDAELGGGKTGARPYGKVKLVKGGRAGHERSSPFSLFGDKGAGKGGAADGCRVFVGNLPYSVRWQQLKDHMRSVGNVVFCDIMEEPGTANNSKGCGLVEFSTPREARAAVKELTGTEMSGRPIFVREDREAGHPVKARGGLAGGRVEAYREAGGAGSGSNCSVYVGNLAYSVTWQMLKDHMMATGEVVYCDIMAAPGTTMGSAGWGLVQYATPSGARRAIRQLTDTVLNGRPIFVREDREGELSEGGKGLGGGGKGGRGSAGRVEDPADRRVFVGNLAFRVTWKELKDHMRRVGEVVHCDVLEQPGTNFGSKGCGIVEYASAAAARRAIRSLTDTYLEGRLIFVREDRE